MASHKLFPRLLSHLFCAVSTILPVVALISLPSHALAAPLRPQTLAQRSSVAVIDTPVPAVKWRITDGAFVERTVDGGATWHGQELAASGSLLAGSAPNATACWLVGRNGLIFLTKDAKKWKKLSPPASVDLVAISAKNASSAVATASDGRRFSTHDGGKKWTEVPAHATPQ